MNQRHQSDAFACLNGKKDSKLRKEINLNNSNDLVSLNDSNSHVVSEIYSFFRIFHGISN